MSQQYGSKTYWDSRFAGEDEFDWYHKWNPVLKKQFADVVGDMTDMAILNIGCGNSSLSRDMYEAGIENITNMDFSEPVIESMHVKHQTRFANMKWEVASVEDMTEFAADDAFDVVIDKGCLDCILCGDESTKRITGALKEVSRALKPGGTFISISFAEDRNDVYNNAAEFQWTNHGELPAGVYKLKKPEASNVPAEGCPYYFMYVYKKN